MCGIGHIRSAVAAGFLLTLPASAAPLSPTEQTRAFADCAGRYAALTEHQWIFDGPASEVSGRRRDAFAALLEAAGTHAQGSQSQRAVRAAARAAQRHLLETASFAAEPEARQHAGALAASFIAICDRLIVGS